MGKSRTKRKKKSKLDAILLDYAKERTSSGQSQALWTFFIFIVAGIIAIFQITQPSKSPEKAFVAKPQVIEHAQQPAQREISSLPERHDFTPDY